jgi:hypothetical protein
MRVFVQFVVGGTLLGLAASSAWAKTDCEPVRCNAQLQADISACPCPSDNSSNHGRYVSCVAHAVNAFVASDPTIPRNCKGKVVRCAARSTCGKPGFVVCNIPVVFGTCDLSSGTPGTCSLGTSTTGTCLADTDCVVESTCKIKSSEQRCLDRGGTVDPNSTTCCAACQ